jgi:hypothetical protein
MLGHGASACALRASADKRAPDLPHGPSSMVPGQTEDSQMFMELKRLKGSDWNGEL